MSPKTEEGSLKVLMIEDNPGDVRLVHELLSEHLSKDLTMLDAADLAAGLAVLRAQTFHAVLLDLSLPDADCPDCVTEIRETEAACPIIVLTGSREETKVREAFQAGADDYLVKESVNGEILNRTIRNAIERRNLARALENARAAIDREREWSGLEHLAAPSPAARTAASYGERPLDEASSGVWDLLIAEYGGLLEAALENRAFQSADASSRTRSMAQRLGGLRAEPRDVVKIHMAAIRRASENASAGRMVVINEESRLLLVEVMGYLVLYYRAFMGPAPYQRQLQTSS